MGDLSHGLVQSYYDYARRGAVFSARATVTAPVIYSTAAGTGGPLLWNGTNNLNAVILAVTCGVTVVTTVAAAIGLTGGSGQTSAPAATTAIDTSACLRIGENGPLMSVYRVGTPSAAGTFFLPLFSVHTGALTVDTGQPGLYDIGGMVVVPPNCWVSIAASATASTLQANFGLIWAEESII
jgi:hypothetical protein